MSSRAIIHISGFITTEDAEWLDDDEQIGDPCWQVLVTDGPRNSEGRTHLDIERDIEDDRSVFLEDMRDYFQENAWLPGLYTWIGSVEYCRMEWHGDTRCDCGGEVIFKEFRPATVEDLIETCLIIKPDGDEILTGRSSSRTEPAIHSINVVTETGQKIIDGLKDDVL